MKNIEMSNNLVGQHETIALEKLLQLILKNLEEDNDKD